MCCAWCGSENIEVDPVRPQVRCRDCRRETDAELAANLAEQLRPNVP